MIENDEADEARDRLAYYQAAACEILARYRYGRRKMLEALATQNDMALHPPALAYWRDALANGIRSFEAADEALVRLVLIFSGQLGDADPTPDHGFIPVAFRAGDTWLVVAPAADPDGRRFFSMIPDQAEGSSSGRP